MDSTYLVPYLIRFVVSYGIVAALAFYAISKTGGIKTSAMLMLLVVGSMIPLTAIADGLKAKKLCYAATGLNASVCKLCAAGRTYCKNGARKGQFL